MAFTLAVHAASVDAVYSFGDSLSDAGNAFIATGGSIPGAPYVNGQFSNGPIWLDTLAAGLGLPPVTPSLATGMDYAVGSAESGNTLFHAANIADLPSQLASFASAHPAADPNALYTIWIGSNDLADIPSTATPTQIAIDIGQIANNVDSAIGALAAAGAKNFLLVTVPDLGKTPLATSTGDSASASAASLALDQTLVSGAAMPGIQLNILDTYSLIDAIVANPGMYGLSNVTDACLTGEVNYSGGTPCSTPDQYLFWDQIHPTAAGHALVGDAALSVLAPEPGTVCLLMAGFGGMAFLRRRSKV